MITSLVSAILGLVSGAVPDILDVWKNKNDHQMEMERLRFNLTSQVKLAEINASIRGQELELEADVAEAKSYGQQMESIQKFAAQKVGITWIDGWNAIIRPATASFVMMMFIAIAIAYSVMIIGKVESGDLTPEMALTVLWGSLIGEAIQAVLGFLFGYRSSGKRLKTLL